MEYKNAELYESGSGGRLRASGAEISMNGSIGTEIYIALFGGNTEREGVYTDWFGNAGAMEAHQVRSETEAAVIGMTLTAANIAKLELALENDLSKFEKYTEISYSVTAKKNAVEIKVSMDGIGEVFKLSLNL